MDHPLFESAAPRLFSEVVEGLKTMGCHELAAELHSLHLGRWTHDPETGALSIQLVSADSNEIDDNIVATGYGRSLALRLRGTVLLELDNFGRAYGLEIFDRDDFFEELRGDAP